jgi:hypothetical protein
MATATHEPHTFGSEPGTSRVGQDASLARTASPRGGSGSLLSPRDTAEALLCVGGRSLWADLEGRDTRPDERRPLPSPGRFRDTRAERLLLGCCLAGGRLCSARAHMAGLRAEHFTEPRYRDLWPTLSVSPAFGPVVLRRLHLMADYLDAERVVNEDRWHLATENGEPLPTQSFIACDVAAQGLAERIVRLAKVREKLREAEQLLNGRSRPQHTAIGGVSLHG